ncbi:uncharacterized protein LOC126655337 [Mercurialis annua]|uniref:uncharacterized protein LOC126655337 n=1 Tax=Mercurialis annua TaxID=3986 RepID=UPI00215E707D|nr:uncharacterized protein LOC126655337 [Mercurialis annua]
MKFSSLIIRAYQNQQQQKLSMCYFREMFRQVNPFLFILLLSCTFFYLAACGPCLNGGIQKSAEYNGCESLGDDSALYNQDAIVADARSDYSDGSSGAHISINSICTSSHTFCFPSTLSGFSSYEHKLKKDSSEVSKTESDRLSSIGPTKGSKGASNRSWFSDSGMFELLNGQIVSCYLNAMDGLNELPSMQTGSANQNDPLCRGPLMIEKSTDFRLNMNIEIKKSSSFDVSTSPPHVEISPPVLDWGDKHLYSPSVAFLTVANTCNDSNLHIYEPFSTNIQFYPCNFSEFIIGPGEVASVCFVFLPRWLGLSSAQLILQSSFGGFLVQVKGYGLESPYKISPVFNLDASSGRLIQKLSLFNPFNENIHVKEISALISASQGNDSHHTKAICSLENLQDFNGQSLLNVEDWLVVKRGQVGFPLMAMRPHENWEIVSHGNETVIEMDFSFESEAEIVVALCVQLLRSSQDEPDTILVPLEIDLDGKVVHGGVQGSASVSFEAWVPCHSRKTCIAISLRNESPHVLRVVKINEISARKVFTMKYIPGLLLFPGAVTQVATITCARLVDELHDSPPEISNGNKNCKLVLLTNDSSSPQIEIPCLNIVHICSRHQKTSSIGLDLHSENESFNRRTGALDSGRKFPSEIVASERTEGDDNLLENWKSQGTSNSMSVLDYHEVLFPMVQVGTQHSQWITVKNPSEQPVVMQLILNSGQIVDECRGADDLMEPLSPSMLVHNEFTTTRYGFSIAEGARTEVYVHAYGESSLGPIFFHPSHRCGWSSSALIRNNLSGVEWLSLRGFGGSLSLVLLDGSEPVQSIEFNLNLPFPLNISTSDLLSHVGEATYACSKPLTKELYAKNMGDLPLEVKRIEVSGTECGLDGFLVHTCNGFSLEPGETMKLLISYQSDFYAAIIQRDLRLALASGFLVIPLKASLPLHMFYLCKKSVFWMWLNKFTAVFLLSASLIFLIFCCIFPEVINFGSQEYSYNSEKNSMTAVRNSGKSARLHHNQKNSKVSISTEMDGLLRSATGGKISRNKSGFKYPDDKFGPSTDHGTSTYHNGLSSLEKHKQVPSLLSKSVEVENSVPLEASQPCNLTVKIIKEKGRRRRKRKGIAAGLTGLLDVSSSQSGNSTPSSPLSPATSLTPNRTWSPSHDTDRAEARELLKQVDDQQCVRVQVAEPASKATILKSKDPLKRVSSNLEQQSLPEKTTRKPVLSPSATFPSTGRTVSNLLGSTPSLASTSTIAPHARAPGPKLYSQNKVEKVSDDYTYDIWGNHFSGLHLVGSSDVTTLKTSVTENNCNSFFVSGPQALVTKVQPKSVSYIQEEG